MSQIRPGMNVVPLSQEEDAAWNDLARQQGVSKAEAIRKMAEMIPPIPQHQPKKAIVNETLNTIQAAREMAIVDADPKDPVNQVMRYGLFKDLRKDMKKGDEDRMSTREIMEMNMVNFQMIMLQKTMGNDNNQSTPPQIQQMLQKYDQTIADLKAENDKSRQFYEQKLKEQEDKFKEIVLEKRIKDIEEGQEKTLQTLSQQIAEIDNQLKLYQNIPQTPTPEQKKDAIEHLEQMGGTLERIKKALTPFGIIPQQGPGGALPAGPGASAASAIAQYRNPDGSMNMTLYGIDKATEVAGRLMDAWSRKAPEPKQVQETMMTGEGNGSAGAAKGQAPPQKQMTYQEFYVYLLNKGSLTPEEQQWKKSYEEYLTKIQQERTVKEQPAQQQQTNEADYTDIPRQEQAQPPTSEQVPEPTAPESKKGIVERMQQYESESNRYSI